MDVFNIFAGGGAMVEDYVLVTGGAGFIGVNLVHRLLSNNSLGVINLDKLTYAGNMQSLDDLSSNPNHVFVHGDIGNRELVRYLLRKYEPRAIFNLAAESHVDRSIVDGASFLQTNVLGTYNLLDEARSYWLNLDIDRKPLFRFIHVSTDEVYGSLGETGRFTEISRTLPNSPYAASKAASDHFVRAFFQTYGFPTVTTNCSNNYGPFQFPEKLIPLIINNALDGISLPVYGDGANVRDWIYVEDHCAALELVMERNRPGEVYNIGANDERKNIDVVRMICAILDELKPAWTNEKLAGRGLKQYSDLIYFVPDRPGHDRRYSIDSSKIKREIGWSPKVSFEDGLKLSVQWYLDHPEWVEHVKSGEYKDWIYKNYSWRLEEK
jgi:dTDP-glucose 4,6-dehydratase